MPITSFVTTQEIQEKELIQNEFQTDPSRNQSLFLRYFATIPFDFTCKNLSQKPYGIR